MSVRDALRYTTEIGYLKSLFSTEETSRNLLTQSNFGGIENLISDLVESELERGRTEHLEELFDFQNRLLRLRSSISAALDRPVAGSQIRLVPAPPQPERPAADVEAVRQLIASRAAQLSRDLIARRTVQPSPIIQPPIIQPSPIIEPVVIEPSPNIQPSPIIEPPIIQPIQPSPIIEPVVIERPVEPSTAETTNDGDEVLVSCPICFDEYPARLMRAFLACNHLYCSNCMEHHLTTLINDNQVQKIVCPEPSCGAEPAEYEVEALVPRAVYDKYLQFTVLAVVQRDPNMCWCPNAACGNAILWDREQKEVRCPACKREFCFDCGANVHVGKDCKGQSNVEEKFREWLERKGRRVKNCPACRWPVEKNEGCNMTCKCGHQWCWLCSATYEGNHFGEGGPCEGMQFTSNDDPATPERQATPPPREPTPERWEEPPAEAMLPVWEPIPDEIWLEGGATPAQPAELWEEIPAYLLQPDAPSTSSVPSAAPVEPPHRPPELPAELREQFARRMFLRFE